MTAKAAYLAHYLDSIETLPAELRRNFTLMQDLDQRAQDEMQKIDSLTVNFLENINSLSGSDKAEEMVKIKKLFRKAMDYGDDKVELAMQTYEMVDKHIRRLDADLARFEADLKGKANPDLVDAEVALKKKGSKSIEKEKKKGKKVTSDNDEIPKFIRKKGKVPTITQPEVGALPSTLAINPPSGVLDMPVDPNEPTYCFCHQVSYGEMIGCDNPDCPIEWFHFSCLGLTSKPKGKWYCSNCSPA
ncbi:inhibitor of growth protein 4-like [Uloborus diversus]|uniref:inhibitor of growth protein 4-like n=1 Tax=Uloborus diversus TaxID=327109 RepID=UPI00240913D7|nr:inhibitor of growth protein 4-like [Uloborus diversus]